VSFYRDKPNIGLSSSRLWRNGKVSSDDRDNLSLFLKPAVAVRDWPGRLLLSAFVIPEFSFGPPFSALFLYNMICATSCAD
jgi:hypothetical protein